MKKEPFYQIRSKSYWSWLDYDRTKDIERNYEVGRGYYVSKYGDVVRIHHHTGYKNFQCTTNLEYIYEGKIHEKIYYETFTNHGLSMIASAFIRFVENN